MFYQSGLTYYISFAVSLVYIIGISILLKRKFQNKEEEQKLIPVKVLFIILLLAEIAKIFAFIHFDHGLKPKRFPIVFCSIFLYLYPMFCFKETKYSYFGKVMSVIPAFIASFMFFLIPSTLSTSNAFDILITFHSFFFHSTLLVVAIYLISSKLYRFKRPDYKIMAIGLNAYILGASLLSVYINETISVFGPKSSYVKFVYDLFGYYPGTLLMLIVFYFVTVALYYLIAKEDEEAQDLK